MKQARQSGRLGLWVLALLTAVSVVFGGCGSGTPTSIVGVSATPSAKPILITPSPSPPPTPARQTFVETKGSSKIVSTAVAVALADGRVLLNGKDDVLTDIYDPRTDSFIATGPMQESRMDETVTLLRDGRVLFAGGVGDGGGGNVLDSAELYDPASGTFSYTAGRPVVARADATATLLADGRVLIVGGVTNPARPDPRGGPPLSSAEIFDPATERFTLTGALEVARQAHGANLLPDGDVLITGGIGPKQQALAETEIYHPATGRFTRASSMSIARSDHTATTLADGRILIAGGEGGPQGEMTASAELYDPATGHFVPTRPLTTLLDQYTSTRLLDGSVLIVGLDWNARAITAEVYDPAAGAFRYIGPLPPGDTVDAAVLLPSGLVFVVMGAGAQALTLLYQP